MGLGGGAESVVKTAKGNAKDEGLTLWLVWLSVPKNFG
jgi:hypothetical protein